MEWTPTENLTQRRIIKSLCMLIVLDYECTNFMLCTLYNVLVGNATVLNVTMYDAHFAV